MVSYMSCTIHIFKSVILFHFHFFQPFSNNNIVFSFEKPCMSFPRMRHMRVARVSLVAPFVLPHISAPQIRILICERSHLT